MNRIEQWILQILYDGPEDTMAIDISEEIGINCFVVNGHLSILRHKGLVKSKRKSGMILLYLTESGKVEAQKIFGGVTDAIMDEADRSDRVCSSSTRDYAGNGHGNGKVEGDN